MISPELAKTMCSIYPDRPAAARCPMCRRFFCAECITEHEGRLICTSCLAKITMPSTAIARHWRVPIWPAAQFLGAILVTWLVFPFFAGFLRDLPDEFHDGTIWEQTQE
jgi:hypothetical protein